MDRVKERSVDWLWYPYLAKRFVTIVEGNPGTGKSYLIQKVAMAIADGEKLPSERPKTVTGKTVFFDLENPPEEVTKSRLAANGCENQRNYFQVPCAFSIDDPDALLSLEKTVRVLKPKLVVFDTLNHYVGDVDLHRSAEAATAVGEFARIAQEYDCAVVLIRHLRKSTTSAVLMGQGNASIAGTARIVAAVGRSPEDPKVSVVVVTKNNIGATPRALEFSVTKSESPRYPDRSTFEWRDFSDLTADDIFAPVKKSTGRQPKERESCEDWILDMVANRAVRATDLNKKASNEGHSKSTFDRARRGLRKAKEIERFKKSVVKNGKKVEETWWRKGSTDSK